MDTTYLKENVGDVLSMGLAATIRANAPDPVEYLARWLVKHVNHVEQAAEEAKKLAELKAADAVAETAEAAVKVESAKKVVEEKKVVDDREHKFQQYMNDIKGPDGMFEGFIDNLKTCTGASGVYVGRLESPEVMKYIATTEADRFLMEKSLNKGQGVTFDMFEDPEEEEEAPEQYDDDGNVIPVVKKEPEPRTMFVPDLLMGPLSDRVHFFRLPRPGCYYAMRLSYSSTLNDESLDQAVEKETRRAERAKRNAERQRKIEEREAKKKAAKTKKARKQLEDEEGDDDDLKMEEDSEDSEEEREREERERKKKDEEDAAEQDGEGDEPKKEEKKSDEKVESPEEKEERLKKEADDKRIKDEERLFAKVQKQTVHLALCLDTVGQNRRFTDAEMKLVVAYGKKLLAILIAQDKQLFKDERARRMALIQFNSGFKAKTDDEKDSSMEEMNQQLQKEGKPASAADLAFKYRQELLLSMRGVISEFRTYNVFRGPLTVLQTLFYMLDYTKEEIADPDGKPNWKKIRPRVGDELFNKIRDYDPRDEQKRSHKERYARVAVLRGLMEGHDYETLKTKNFPLAEIFAFVKDALAVKRQASRERKAKKKAELEAKLKAEEDAAAAAEAKREADELAEEEARLAAEEAQRLKEEEGEDAEGD